MFRRSFVFSIDHDVIIGQLCAKWLADGGLLSPLN